MPIVYLTTNKVNGKKYIGYDGKNDASYLGSGKILKMAIEKYGAHNFTKDILAEFENESDALSYEKEMINKHNAVNSNYYYNIQEGGKGGWAHINTKGENNPMYGKSLLDVMIKKYGIEEGVSKYEESRKKSSDSYRGKKIRSKTEDERLFLSEKRKTYYENLTEEKRMELGKSISNGLKSANIKRSDEYKTKMRESMLIKADQIHRREICIYCGKEANISNIKRWHDDNCKNKPHNIKK